MPVPADMPSNLVLNNCSLIDGRSNTPISHTAVKISDGRVAGIGAGPADTVIDLTGCTVLPGFINAHSHPGFKQQAGGNLPGYDRHYLAGCLATGVTTVRDMGALNTASLEDVIAARDDINREACLPRVVSPGKFLAAPGGYGGAAPLAITDRRSAQEAVRHVARAGADFVKTSLEYGLSPDTRGLPLLSDELLRVVCETAHELGLTVSAHLTQTEPLRRLIEAGVDEAAHVPYDPMEDDLIARMVRDGIVMVPTLIIERMISEKYGAPLLPVALDNVRRFHAAGGVIAVGDDFVEEERPWFTPSLPLGELELLQRAGLSNMAVLKALTVDGARVCGIAAETGTVEPGKCADLTVVRGDPVTDLGVLRDVVMVIRQGQVVVDNRARIW